MRDKSYSPNGEEDVNIDLVRDVTWLIQNPQWVSNLHWISAANEEMSGNFISHLIDSGSDSLIESLGTYLVLDSLEVLLAEFMGLLYSEKVHKHPDMSNVENTAFSIIITLQILRKLEPVLYVWSDSEYEVGEGEVIAGMP